MINGDTAKALGIWRSRCMRFWFRGCGFFVQFFEKSESTCALSFELVRVLLPFPPRSWSLLNVCTGNALRRHRFKLFFIMSSNTLLRS